MRKFLMASVLFAAAINVGGAAGLGGIAVTKSYQETVFIDQPGGWYEGIIVHGSITVPQGPVLGGIWAVVVELDPSSPDTPPSWWQFPTPFTQPWNNAGTYFWAVQLNVFDMPNTRTVEYFDWPAGVYTFRAKLTYGTTTTSMIVYSAPFTVYVYDD